MSKEKQIAQILDIPLSKYGHMFLKSANNSKKKSRSKRDYTDANSDGNRQKDSRSYSRAIPANVHNKKKKLTMKQPINFLFNIKGLKSTSAKKRKKSSKRSKGKEDSGSRVRFRDERENKTLE